MIFSDSIARKLLLPRLRRPSRPIGGPSGAEDDTISAAQPLLGGINSGSDGPALAHKPGNTPLPPSPQQHTSSAAQRVAGFVLAILSGVFGAVQYAVVTEGKRFEMSRAGCSSNTTSCPSDLLESFDNFGSWMVSFGIGALAAALLALCMASLLPGCDARRLTTGDDEKEAEPLAANTGSCRPPGLPNLNWRVLRVAGVAAGLFWVIGNFSVTAAVRLHTLDAVLPCPLRWNWQSFNT